MKLCRFTRFLRSGWHGSIVALFIIAFTGSKADTPPSAATPIALASPQAEGEPQSWEIPFAYDPPGHPLITVQVRVNQSAPLTFIVDTGADNILVFPWACRLLDLKSTGITIPSSSGKSVASLLQPCDLHLQAGPGSHDFTIHAEAALMAEVQTLEAYPGPHVAGIVGGFVFQKMASRFDFDRKTLSFFSAKAALPRPAGPFAALTLFREAGRDRSAVQIALPGAPLTPFILDTGSDTSSAPAALSPKISALATGRTWFQNMDGSQSLSLLLLAELPLGDLSAEMVEIGLRPDRSQGLLGLNVLNRFRVTLDPHAGLLTLEPRPGYQGRLSGHTGSLEEHGGVFTIAGIEDMAAKRGGVRIGDRIVAINGDPAKGMNAMEAELRFNGYEGVETALEMEKPDGKRYAVRLRPRSHFPSVIRSSMGMLLLHAKGQSARVIGVEADSEAARSGIRRGDTLLLLNSRSTADLTASALLHELGEDTAGKSPLKSLALQQSGKADALVLEYDEGSLKKTH